MGKRQREREKRGVKREREGVNGFMADEMHENETGQEKTKKTINKAKHFLLFCFFHK